MLEDSTRSIEASPLNRINEEFLTALSRSGIQLNEEILKNLQSLETHWSDYRYGGPFALVSGNLLLRSGEDGPESLHLLDKIFQSSENLDTDDRMGHQNKDAQQVREYYRALREQLLIHPEFQLHGTRLLWQILESAAGIHHPEFVDAPSFMFTPERKTRWENCKDSESYLSTSLRGTDERKDNGARAAIFCQNGEPVLYQKIGGFKISHGAKHSNATAINLVPIIVNEIELPPGTLLGLSVKDDQYVTQSQDRVFDINQIVGIRPLRLTIYAAPVHEAHATFGCQYEDFQQNVLRNTSFRSLTPTLQDFIQTAHEITHPLRTMMSSLLHPDSVGAERAMHAYEIEEYNRKQIQIIERLAVERAFENRIPDEMITRDDFKRAKKLYDALTDDPVYQQIRREVALEHLRKYADDSFKKQFTTDMTPDGYLLKINRSPSFVHVTGYDIRGNSYEVIMVHTYERFARRFPDRVASVNLE